MLIKWNGDGIKVIPKSDKMGSVVLVPGYNDVMPANWKYARDRVIKDIEAGRIVEEWTKISPEQVKDYAITIKDEKANYGPADLKDINRPRVKDVVRETYSIPVLEKWLDEELRQDVRLEILKQLADIDKGNKIERVQGLERALDTYK